MLKETKARDSVEAGVFFLQFLEVHVFDGVNGLILEDLIQLPLFFVYYTSLAMLDLWLVSLVHDGICRNRGYTPGSEGLLHDVLERVV